MFLLLEAFIKIALLVSGLMAAAAYLVLVERWVAAWVQDRLGPNRVGIPLTRIRLFGVGQPIADGVKFFLKEIVDPGHVDKLLYTLAPLVIFATALATYAAIPFGSVLPVGWDGAQPIRLVVAPGLNVGAVFVLAMGSIAVYGVLLGGWSSDTKYSFFGSLRSAAQLLSYELPLGLGVLSVVLASGSLRLDAIIAQQAASGVWNVMVQPLGLAVFVVAGFAEAGRLPFDLYEAEQELVGGYHTEYSGAKLMLFLVAEYLHMITVSVMVTILYLGGWHLWGLTGAGEQITWPVAILRVVVLWGKVGAVIFFFMIARWSWPRFRFDQLMDLAWKVWLPLGIVNLVAVAIGVEFGGALAMALGAPRAWTPAVLGWPLLLLSWLVATLTTPEACDNRARTEQTDVYPVEETQTR